MHETELFALERIQFEHRRSGIRVHPPSILQRKCVGRMTRGMGVGRDVRHVCLCVGKGKGACNEKTLHKKGHWITKANAQRFATTRRRFKFVLSSSSQCVCNHMKIRAHALTDTHVQCVCVSALRTCTPRARVIKCSNYYSVCVILRINSTLVKHFRSTPLRRHITIIIMIITIKKKKNVYSPDGTV